MQNTDGVAAMPGSDNTLSEQNVRAACGLRALSAWSRQMDTGTWDTWRNGSLVVLGRFIAVSFPDLLLIGLSSVASSSSASSSLPPCSVASSSSTLDSPSLVIPFSVSSHSAVARSRTYVGHWCLEAGCSNRYQRRMAAICL